jgi:hypothetical protein
MFMWWTHVAQDREDREESEMKKTRLFVLMLVVGGALAAVGSAAALNPQPLPPKIAGIVRDACTGLPVAGATVNLTGGDPAEGNPGPINTGPLGGFLIGNLAPGMYSFSVAAPGYDPVGKNPGPQGTPGTEGSEIDVTANPGPSQLPAGEAVNETILASVLIAPAFPPDPCRNPGPQGVPALSGQIRDGATGLPIFNTQETLTSADPAEKNPGPPGFGAFGLFAWPTLDPGSYTLTLATPRYVSPGPIQVTINPGPTQFSDGSAISFGTNLDIQLGQPPAFNLPTSPYLPKYAFKYGSIGKFTFTTTGSPIPTLSATSPLYPGITFTDNGDGTGTITTGKQVPPGSYYVNLEASNVAGSATQTIIVVVTK